MTSKMAASKSDVVVGVERNSEETFLFTSESVGEGHPDKICDLISDAVLDAHLAEDPFSRVSCQTAAKTGMVFVCGDIVSKAETNYQQVIRDTVQHIGYDTSTKGFDYSTCNVLLAVEDHVPSTDVQNGMYNSMDINAPSTDTALMFGYATNETDECMPLTVILSHQLNSKMAELRRNGQLSWARPDSKTQVTVEYRVEGGATIPIRVHTVVISIQHDDHVTMEKLRDDLMSKVIRSVIPEEYLDDRTIFHLQPSGRFIIGGPQGDAGLTGRKIIVDTYGGWGAHGGGSLSGKDPTKIDRCGSYAARWVALSLVKAGLCKRVLVQVSYAIGVAEPVSVTVFDYGTSSKNMNELCDIVKKNFDLRPGNIINELNLRRPIYQKTASYGHFGRSEFPWEDPKPIQS
ncbi:S-adenosylmethionine synthase-like [Haliotis cracherodii]|uniref:S-adenosylmethionine synthase-like n=2 Tax=Haliotis TaxID=6452 RepID=UPI001EAFF389|nr:S-adenosylmethionine synthase-like isoform X1 [Haliotis rufescens]